MLKFKLKDQNILKGIHNFAKNRRVKLYLVGGVLRDLILLREKANPDFDFAIKRGAINFYRPSLFSRSVSRVLSCDASFDAARDDHLSGRRIAPAIERPYPFRY